MQLLGTEAFRVSLGESIRNASEKIFIVSAYITSEGIQWFANRINSEIKCTIITRWTPNDLLFGASDLESFDIAKSRGWEFFVLKELHAKLYLIDNKDLFIGSANLTQQGLCLVPGGNREMGVKLLAAKGDVSVVNALLEESVRVTDDLFLEIRNWITNLDISREPRKNFKWPKIINDRLSKNPFKLWVADMLWANEAELSAILSQEIEPNKNYNLRHDLALLGFDSKSFPTRDEFVQAFKSSRVWSWLNMNIEKSPKKELFFGTLSVLTHEALLDDPKPYRKDVKKLVQNIFSWVSKLKIPELEVDIPGQQSERIRFRQ